MTRWTLLPIVTLCAPMLAPSLRSQSYDDLSLVRNRPSPYSSLVQFRAGVLGGVPVDKDPSIGLDSELGFDGHAYYRNDQFDGRDAQVQAYAGRDGAYLSVVEGALLGDGNRSRLELSTRYFPFYREGFYRGDDFVPTGRYEGFDYNIGLSISRQIDDDMRLEAGVFYRRYEFDRNETTAPGYVIPDNYAAYGWRTWLEHNTLQLDRLNGRATAGFIFTVMIEQEFNDSDGRFGTTGIYESSLPSSVFRGRGHLEWYFPQSETGTWEFFVDGSVSDKKDRVYNFDAQKPVGHLWVDAELRYRFDLGQSFTVAPLAKGQYVQTVGEAGTGSDSNTFLGGGLDVGVNLGDNFSLIGGYSYLSNESRAPVSASRDTFGEHRFFVGVEVRFTGQRR